MSYPFKITFRVSRAMRDALQALVAERQTETGRLLRSLINREAAGERDRVAEAFDQLLFVALALEGLLQAHSDPDLHAKIIRLWRERLAEEAHRHAQ